MPKTSPTTRAVRAFLLATAATAMVVGAAAAQTRNFNIPASDAAQALQAYARQSGKQVLFPYDAVRGRRAPAVTGARDQAEVLRELAAAAGLAIVSDDGRTVTLRPPGAAASAADVEASVSELVVTAGKREERLFEVGQAVGVVSGEQLENQSANRLLDYAAFIPGVTTTNYGRPGQTKLSIRGITEGVGPGVAVYVDDIPFGSSSNETQGSNYTPDLDSADLERVEILKGPQGTLYGAAALGGVIKYVTRAPNLQRDEFRVGGDLSNVAHGQTGYKIRAAGSKVIIEDVLAARASAYFRKDPGYVDDAGLTGEKDVNRGQSWGARGALLYQPNAQLSVKLGLAYQRTDSEGLTGVGYNSAPVAPPPYVPQRGDLTKFIYVSEPSATKYLLATSEIRYDFGFADLISATGLTRYDLGRITDVTGTYTRPGAAFNALGANPNTIVFLENHYNIDKLTQEFRLQSKDNEKFEWQIGAYYQKETSDVNVQGTAVINGIKPPEPRGTPALGANDNSLKEYAAFVNATYYITPKLDISAGYRHSRLKQDNSVYQVGLIYAPTTPTVPITRHDVAKDKVNSYAFGARFRPTEDIALYARAASAFRPGGGRSQPPVVIPDFKFTYEPDSVWSYETGVKAKAWDNRINLEIALFHIDWKKIQAFVPVGGGFSVQGNGGDAVSKGYEAMIEVRPLDGLQLVATYANVDSHYTETVGTLIKGKQVAQNPKQTASFRANYERDLTPDWKGFIGMDYRAQSSLTDAVGRFLPAFDYWGANAGVERDTLRIGVYVQNLTDKRGLTGYTGGGIKAGDAYRYAVLQPRTVGVNVSKAW